MPHESSLRTTPPLFRTWVAARETRSLMCFCSASQGSQPSSSPDAERGTDIFGVVGGDAYELVEGHGGGEQDVGACSDSELSAGNAPWESWTHSVYPRGREKHVYSGSAGSTTHLPTSSSRTPLTLAFRVSTGLYSCNHGYESGE